HILEAALEGETHYMVERAGFCSSRVIEARQLPSGRCEKIAVHVTISSTQTPATNFESRKIIE
ncbi:hypothetical protein A2U01_0055406, partial [Trifolium medium]|nr:hypothetical protein [Trifolium medium]